jgi:hypothetical protein
MSETTFFSALIAPGRAADIPAESDLYGWLVGSWALEVRHYGVDVSGRGLTGEAHFAWVLDGRAVQDVWLMHRRGPDGPRMYGSTLRAWDGTLGAWRVTWTDPTTGQRDQLIGRKVGDDLVQLGTHASGTPIRWCFTEITPRSFRWTGEVLEPDARTWRLEGEFLATRRS